MTYNAIPGLLLILSDAYWNATGLFFIAVLTIFISSLNMVDAYCSASPSSPTALCTISYVCGLGTY